MKIKRSCSFFLILAVMIALNSCDPVRRYEGENKALIATALYSIPGVNSRWNDSVQILEQDDYGRILFAICMSDSLLIRDSWDNYILAVLIMQKGDAEHAYFYAEKNYSFKITKEFVDLSEKSIEEFFSMDDILVLKEKNDWNRPYDEENESLLCISVSSDKSKRLSDISENIIDSRIGSNYRYSFFREDQEKRNLYLITNIIDSSYEYYLVIFSEEGMLFDEKSSIRKISIGNPEKLPDIVQGFLCDNSWGDE